MLLVEALRKKRAEVTNFLLQQEKLPLLEKPKLVSVIDTAASHHPWNGHKNANRSRKGTDMSEFAVYSEHKKQWFFLWVKGGNIKRRGVRAHVRKWNAGDYGKRNDVGSFVATWTRKWMKKKHNATLWTSSKVPQYLNTAVVTSRLTPGASSHG